MIANSRSPVFFTLRARHGRISFPFIPWPREIPSGNLDGTLQNGSDLPHSTLSAILPPPPFFFLSFLFRGDLEITVILREIPSSIIPHNMNLMMYQYVCMLRQLAGSEVIFVKYIWDGTIDFFARYIFSTLRG